MKHEFQLHWNTEYGVRLYIQYLTAGEIRVITHIYKEKEPKGNYSCVSDKHRAVDETWSQNEDCNISQYILS